MSTSSFKNLASRHDRGGFTLVELLLVVAIIAVLSTMAVGVLGSAQNDARVAATRSRINIIQKILEIELEDYEVRRSPVPFRVLGNMLKTAIDNGRLNENDANGNPISFVHLKNLKRMVEADFVRLEMPNGRSDSPVFDGSQMANELVSMGRFPSEEFGGYLVDELGFTDADVVALRGFARDKVNRWIGWGGISGDPAVRDDEERFIDSSELLYAILSSIEYDGNRAVDSLGDSAVGDNDGDGILEIVDGWGEPISFAFQQSNLQTADVRLGVWSPIVEGQLTDLSFGENASSLVKPVRIDQIRPFLRSEKLFEIDGPPQDFEAF